MSEHLESDFGFDKDTGQFETEEKLPTKKPFLSGFTKVLLITVLSVGLGTAAIAQTAPQLLAPITSLLPDSIFSIEAVPLESTGEGSFEDLGTC